jgi:ribosome biogenesis GTPase A
MLYSLSILYKSKIPLCVVFNKIDILDCKFATEWMTDFDKFDEALSK